MSRVIESPVKRWPGTVTLPDALNYPQYIALTRAWAQSQALGEAGNLAEQHAEILPAVLACVEKWELANFPSAPTLATFPATPPVSSARLLSWLIVELAALLREADEDPNG